MDDSSTNRFALKNIHSFVTPALLPVIILATCVIYWPGLSGTFILDDIHTLQSLNKLGGVTSISSLTHFMSDSAGIFGRPVSMLSLLIDDQYFPGDPAKYRYTNLMLHLLCGLFLLLFLLKLLELTCSDTVNTKFVALTVVALWLVHPLSVSTTLYIVQRMTQVMTLFTLIGLTFFVYGRGFLTTRAKLGVVYITAAFIPFGILAVLSKENGILLCMYVLVLELTVLRRMTKPGWYKWWTSIFVIAPLVLVFTYLTYRFGNHFKIYELRDFSLTERLLTEFRILISYLYQIIIPPSSKTGLYHDDYQISTSIFSPFTTLPAVIFVLCLLLFAIKLRVSQPFASLAILWFFGGHILESTVIPLELYFEHRNYLPMVGPLLGLIYYVHIYAKNLKNIKQKYLIHIIPVVLIMMSTLFTYQSATIWSKPEIMYTVWHREHPDSLRAATMYAQMLEKNGHIAEALSTLDATYQDHPDTISLPLYMLALSCQKKISPKYSAQDIISKTEDAVYRDALTFVSQRLINTVKNNGCEYISMDELLSLLNSLVNVNRLRGMAKIQMILMLSDLYVDKGMLSPAVETLDRAFEIKRMPSIAVKQADLLSTAGLYDDALHYIEIAKKADQKRPFYRASYTNLIQAMENHIRSKMK